jgi:hypothetical protein
MNGKRLVTRFALALGLVALAAGIVASLGGARDGANLPPPGKCPAEPAKELSIKFAVSYTRGSTLAGATYCKDGATATKITVNGKPVPDFKNGVCWRDSSGFNITIGTVLAGGRKKVDPAGFHLTDIPSHKFLKDTVHFGVVTKAGKFISWGHEVKLVVQGGAKPKGSFSGSQPTLVNGKLTMIPAQGRFTCKRILKVPG